MKVFITGAGGRIGSHIIPHAISRGHTVTGLVRSPTSAEKIKALGASPLIGSITDRDLLMTTAKSHDAVIHCAMDMSVGREESAKQEHDTLALFGDALEGTGKVLIMSSGAGFLPPGSDEHTLPPTQHNARAATEVMMLGFKDKGVRSISVRLAMNTHNPELMHPFLGLLIGAHEKLGYIPYVGENHWSACNSVDAGLLYVLAMEKAEPGTAVHAIDEFNKQRDIAEMLGKKTGLKVGEAGKEELKDPKMGWLGMLLGMNQDVGMEWTKKTFGWEPRGQRLLDEVRAAPKEYFGLEDFKYAR